MNSKRAYSVTREGSRWLVWSSQPNRFPRIYSTHRTMSAALKSAAKARRANSQSSSANTGDK